MPPDPTYDLHNDPALKNGCLSCGGATPMEECPGDEKRPCGHHCNCSWLWDKCCWCGKEFGEDGE